jgi:hypothetical protein
MDAEAQQNTLRAARADLVAKPDGVLEAIAEKHSLSLRDVLALLSDVQAIEARVGSPHCAASGNRQRSCHLRRHPVSAFARSSPPLHRPGVEPASAQALVHSGLASEARRGLH